MKPWGRWWGEKTAKKFLEKEKNLGVRVEPTVGNREGHLLLLEGGVGEMRSRRKGSLLWEILKGGLFLEKKKGRLYSPRLEGLYASKGREGS